MTLQTFLSNSNATAGQLRSKQVKRYLFTSIEEQRVDLTAWTVLTPGEPMQRETRTAAPKSGEVLVAVAGCGVCHTDLGFYYDGVPTRHGYPLTLGHEISGTVIETGAGAEAWQGKDVIIPAVMPCETCDACTSGHGSICPTQIFPGNDVHGGFASHVLVPALGLCPVPDLKDPKINPKGLALSTLSVIADAVTTPYQAIIRAELCEGDLAVFIGTGGVGGYGVQIAAAMGATVVAIDVDGDKLELMRAHGAALTLRADELDFKSMKKAVRNLAKERGIPTWQRKIFETSGTTPGQNTAFGLLEHGGYLSVVGFTAEKLNMRLSNVMAFDATIQGNWGCLPEHYPAVLDLVLSGKVELDAFVEHRPLSTINETFAALHAHEISKRVILTPDA